MNIGNPSIDSMIHYDQRLQRVIDFIETHFSDVIRLEQAAAAAGLESTYFSKYFRRETGVSFRDWLAGFRLQKACQMMRERKYSITQVAAMCGFGDARNFERAAMKLAGCTPSDLRNALRPHPQPQLNRQPQPSPTTETQ